MGDRASYLYVYANDGAGRFAAIRYDRIGTRPFAFDRIHETFATQLPIATGDLNADGLVDCVTRATGQIGRTMPMPVGQRESGILIECPIFKSPS